MEEKKNIKLLIIAVAAVAIAALFFGLRGAMSYYLEEGKSAMRREDFISAEKNLMRAKLFYPLNPLVHFYLGRTALGPSTPDKDPYYQQANYASAIRRYERAIKLGLEKEGSLVHSRALENIGFSYWNLQQYDKAVGAYLEEIKLYPEMSFWPRYFVALNKFERENQPKEALDILAPTIGLPIPEPEQKNFFRAYSLFSRLYLYFEKFEEAEKYAKLAIENAGTFNRDINVGIAHAILAQIYGMRLDFPLAEKEIAIAEESTETNIYGCTRASVYLLGKNYSKAIAIAQGVGKSENRFYSICLGVLANANKAVGNDKESKKYFSDYLKFTDSLENKDIFIMRRRALAEKELK